MKRIALVLLAAFAMQIAQAQVKAVEDFVKNYPDLKKYYLYQSTLRMLNKDNNPDFNKLIKDVKKINAYVAEGNSDITKGNYDKMVDNLMTEGFELYAKAKYEGAHINLVGKDKGKNSYFVLALRDDANFALLELDGQLDLAYMTVLNDLDFESLTDVILQSSDESEVDD